MPTASHIKAVLFDLDDTLFDHRYSSARGLTAVHENYPCFGQKTFDEFMHVVLLEFEVDWLRALHGEVSIEMWLNGVFRQIFIQYREPSADALSIEAAQRFKDSYYESRKPIAGAVELLEILKPQVKVGIVTNHRRAEQEGKLKHCKLEHLVDFLLCSEDVGTPKPDRKIFDTALQQADCKAEEAVMVGDSWSADMMGALGMGIRAVWFNPDGTLCPDPTCVTEIKSLEPAESVAKMLLGDGNKR
jgi:HAD superfamily hydrolase (TIGR01549 family)